MRTTIALVAALVLWGTASTAGAASPQSDEFNSATLSGFWTVVDPSAPNSYVSLTERPGFLRLSASVIGGGGDYCACSNYNAPRVIQSCSGDWTLEVRMEFSPTFNYQGAGIFAPFPTTGDSAAWRVAERAYYPNAGGQVVRCLGSYVPYSGSVTYFRIVKLADTLSGYWSADGVNWNFNGKASMFPTALGVFAVCHDWSGGNTNPAVADFDYFRISNASTPAPGMFCDAFTGSSLDPPSPWVQSGTACGFPAEVGGELQLAQTGGCAAGYVGVELDPARYAVRGDFDIQVGYRLPDFSVPPGTDTRVMGLRLLDDSQAFYATIERYNQALGSCNSGTQNYKGWFTISDNCNSAVRWVASSDAVGKFRITRTGTLVTEYYWSGGWVPLNSATLPDQSVHVVLYAVNVTGATAFDARFDSLCVDADLVTAVARDAPPPGSTLRLEAAPNPFSAATHLSFTLAIDGDVELAVFDITGRRVTTLLDGPLPAGSHRIVWQPAALRAGMYMVRLRTRGEVAVRRLLFAR